MVANGAAELRVWDSLLLPQPPNMTYREPQVLSCLFSVQQYGNDRGVCALGRTTAERRHRPALCVAVPLEDRRRRSLQTLRDLLPTDSLGARLTDGCRLSALEVCPYPTDRIQNLAYVVRLKLVARRRLGHLPSVRSSLAFGIRM